MVEISHIGLRIQGHRGPLLRIARYAAAGVILFAVTGLWLFRGPLFHGNFYTVIPNEVYRSSQLSPEALERQIKELSLRSVINLRTSEKTTSWLKAEQEVTEVHGVDLHLIRLNVFMPPRKTLQQLVHLLNTARRPLLLHCERGVERSGIASAVAVLLSGRNIAEARKQFSLTYGFVPLICHPDLLKVLDNYGQWLAVRGWSHTPERFHRWVENDYVSYFYRARLEPLGVPASIVRGMGVLMRFRATNTSPQPWRLRSDGDRGVHLGAKVRMFEPSIKKEFELRGGYRNLTVSPGESVVLEIVIPATLESGRYKFFVDLVNERVKWFSDMGSEPITFELRVEDSDTLGGNRGRGHP
jgi:protein tyrosine phosphatase (PTP) superfamily phosphohydrolase (DUF442 family)